MGDFKKDVIIVGGGFGGCAAALSACANGMQVLITEETDWLGGQATSQGVPPDEHQWIEKFGCTASYQSYRRKVRETYMRVMDVKRTETPFNPGNGLVSTICHDPRVSVHVLNEMLLPYVLTNQLTIKYNTTVISVDRDGRQLKNVRVKNAVTGAVDLCEATYFIDATETGELLPLAGVEYVTGAEAKTDTFEPHALEIADPQDIQAFSYVLVMEYREGENHIIPEPETYSFWKEFHPPFWPDKYLSFFAPHPITKEKRQYTLFREDKGFPLWEYRRSYDKSQFTSPIVTGDVSLMNWPQSDYFLGNIYDVCELEKTRNSFQAKQLSLSLFYWLQTEAPRPDGKRGYPGLKLRKDVFGTSDGLAKAAYIRESRRIRAEYTVVEQDVSPDFNKGLTGKLYDDRVGIGSYSIDLHPSMAGKNYLDIEALPFHIPLGALIPKDLDNLLAGCKNIGTTHITNGCYRLHPTEWNIGEACGSLAAFCIQTKATPKTVRETAQLLQDFQEQLRSEGFELEWPTEFYE